VLACDLRFAARESAIFSQPEVGFGLVPGAGGMQHLTRLMGRYGWINRALPAAALDEFVGALAHRIAGVPAAARLTLKERVHAIALAAAEDFRRDSDLFLERARDPESQRRTKLAMTRGFLTHDGELTLANMVADLADR